MKTITELKKDKKGIFGLTSVQQFFVVILGIALLAYVIVIIMGTLQTSSILTYATETTINESGQIGYGTTKLAGTLVPGFGNPVIVKVYNVSEGLTAVIPAGNYTVTLSGVVYNATSQNWNMTYITYSYNKYSTSQKQTSDILGNTSNGITGFFSNINPIYAILAVLVIILVLVVLVRVVSSGQGGVGGRRDSETML
jgi:uncharacterized membrane protein